MKLLIDMNLAPKWVALLKDNGFEALHWSTVGQVGSAGAKMQKPTVLM